MLRRDRGESIDRGAGGKFLTGVRSLVLLESWSLTRGRSGTGVMGDAPVFSFSVPPYVEWGTGVGIGWSATKGGPMEKPRGRMVILFVVTAFALCAGFILCVRCLDPFNARRFDPASWAAADR